MFNGDDMVGPIEGNSDGLEFELNEFFVPEVNNASPSNTIAISNSSDNKITNQQ